MCCRICVLLNVCADKISHLQMWQKMPSIWSSNYYEWLVFTVRRGFRSEVAHFAISVQLSMCVSRVVFTPTRLWRHLFSSLTLCHRHSCLIEFSSRVVDLSFTRSDRTVLTSLPGLAVADDNNDHFPMLLSLFAGISVGHRRDVQRYAGREVEMGIQDVWRGRKRRDRHPGDDENSSSE